jgi:hypothetical protein
MWRWLPLALLMLGLPLDSPAQIIPHVAVFGGYTYVHDKFNGGGTGFSLNGWDGSLEFKPLPLVGFIADVSRQYASPNGIRENQTSVLVGPQISVPGFKRVIPYAHVMAGVAHGTNQTLLVSPQGSSCRLGSCPPGFTIVGISTGATFAAAVGGGVDVKLKGPLWFRAIQADWLHADLSPNHHTQARLSTGIVVRFGR